MAEPQLLTDLRLRLVDQRALSIYAVQENARRTTSGGRAVTLRDIELAADHDNLAQAVAIRLLTPKGELAELAHPDYGSRPHELIGFPNTDTARNLAKLYVIEALKQERRIETIENVTVTPHPGDRNRINISIRLLPIGQSDVLDIGPLTLDLA